MNPQSEQQVELRLSLEELALIFSLLGEAPLAKTMLESQLGELNPDELRGRIMAAGNTLLAKGVFRLDGEKLELASAYAGVLGPMVNADYALQCTTFGIDRPERSMMFYVQGDRIVEHRAHYGLYHKLQARNSLPAVVDVLETFFQLPNLDGFQAMPFALNQEQAIEARLLDDTEASELRDRLERQGVDVGTAARFAEDLGRPKEWVVTLRLRVVPDEGIMAELGYQALTAQSGRTWLITVDGDNGDTTLNVRPAERDAIRALTYSLLATG
jgi:hypothetical protein